MERLSIIKVICVIRINWEVTTGEMYLIYSTEVLLFFTKIPGHIHAFLPSWHNFRNPFVAEIGSWICNQSPRAILISLLLRNLWLPKSCFTGRSTGIVWWDKVYAVGWMIQKFPVKWLGSSWCAGLTGAVITRDVYSTIFWRVALPLCCHHTLFVNW